jgi:hypothetical protein
MADDPAAISDGGIGTTLVIGGSSFDWGATILSQYANSSRIVGVVGAFAEALSQKADIDAFYDMMWNIQTAEGYGLDVWGRIVVVNRVLQINSRFVGFAEGNSGSDYDPFNVSPFYAGQGTSSAFALSDDAFRLLILAKALANISSGSIQGINAILQLLFPGRGACYVTDNQNMTMTYTFGFTPTPVEVAIIETSNVLPRPAGVKVLFSIPP